MSKKQHHSQPLAARGDSEARRWMQRAREVGEVAAQAEYHREERQRPRTEHGGYDWWRSHVHRPLHDATPRG